MFKLSAAWHERHVDVPIASTAREMPRMADDGNAECCALAEWEGQMRWSRIRAAGRAIRGAWRRVAIIGGIVAFFAGASHPAVAQTGDIRREVIQGRVTRDGVVPVDEAEVIVTMAPDRQLFRTRTDSAGKFRIVIAAGTGDYLVHVGRIGFTEFRRRYTRSGADSVLTVDARMRPITPVLEAVEVLAPRAKPPRDAGRGTQTGAAEQIAEGLTGSLSPDLEGNLAAIAANMPGIITTPDGSISAFGLGAAANSVTLNGMAFSGADIPRDANVQTKVATSAYDPSRGWFSGVQTTVDLRPGDIVSHRKAHITLDAPQLQYGDPISARLGQRIQKVDGSYSANGPVGSSDRYLYNFALQVNHASADASSVLSADPFLLQHAGVSPDSAARFGEVLQQARVPIVGALRDPRRTNENLSFIARLDDAPYDWNSAQTKPATVKALTAYGKLSRVQGVALSPTSTTGHAGENAQAIGMLQGLYSTYVKQIYLLDTRSAFTIGENRLTPYVRVPDGEVLVASDLPGSVGGVTDLSFGGNGALATTTRRWTWETGSSLQAYSGTAGKRPHRIKADADVRLDGLSQTGANDQLGSFEFASLADLAASRPSAFTRTLSAPQANGSEWNAFAALGDEWRVTPSFQLLYGVRVEGNAFNAAPAYNPAVERSFGLRTDYAPDTWAVSPRAGFTWLVHRVPTQIMETDLGRFTTGPTTYVRGGVGLFRSMLPASLLSNASTTTGLPGSAIRIVCVGDAVPTPDWSAYAASEAAIPSSCATGATGGFSDRAPPVALFDRAYTAPRSWRANLGVSSAFKSIVLGLDGTYSLNVNQPGVIDANFRAARQFTVEGEGRPVFVPATAVVPSTGRVSALAARIDSAFASVTDNVSDLQSRSRQITVSARPTFTFFDPGSIWSHLYASAAYTWSDVRAQQRGFDGSTFDDPARIEWARGDFDVRHSVITALGLTGRGASFTMYARFSSGFPFTPMVGQDINGDGRANDRAFIVDPTTSKDTMVAAGLSKLLATAPSGVQSCLLRQIGHTAARNSCQGPWTSAMNARITLTGYLLHLPDQIAEISLNLTNPLGGLDQALHGSAHLHGWGTPTLVDPVLYNVRGFDPSSSAFRYEVNPRFGTTSATLNTVRAPFRLTLDVSMDLGRPLQAQLLERWLNQGRAGRPGDKLSATDLVRRYTRMVPDPYNQIIREADSLLLSPNQVTRLRERQNTYQQKMAAHWEQLARYLADLPDVYMMREAYSRQEDMTDEAWGIAWRDLHEALPEILTPVQLTLLPDLAAELWADRESPKGIRVVSLRGR